MRAERWWEKTSVVEQLYQQPTRFELIQATRLLRHYPEQKQSQDWSKSFSFSSSLKLNFPKSEIEYLAWKDQKIQLTSPMIGLTGTQGVLPYTYTYRIKQSPRQQREETLHFLGLFNHKLTAQYIEASINYHLPIRYEIEQENHYLEILHALNGYVREQHQQHHLDDYFAEFSGLMQGQNNSAYVLKTTLGCMFKHRVQIKEYLPEQFKLEDSQKASLGGSNPALLGINTFCGEVLTQIDEKIEIVIGPLNRQDYLEFLPQKKHSEKLKQIISTWCSPTLMVDLRLILSREEIRPIRLGDGTTGLGQGAFLMPQAYVDNQETCYSLMGRAA
ncbi:type VI secretion system baseplate subunit TssG [Acinetobacter sp. LoGeW2-3]|uniref:type VI secretion system baseplate subunit TssG n=1 Tax=Acinetobacter sp. LoGeW2-3 TaxID=1808001 RepID=UPI000C05C19C|nr:type VI secretion system baseplate subunit TssG [Acinetobacter sp. LoGeW2-3]ATO20564.1 type VI secretion system baseplate subunit TssG [Acinetobacter sp. LoGeW2-3]